MIENPESHFIKRAGVYDCSSQWVKDPVLIDKIKRLSDAGPDDYVLDLAVGTGKIAEAFRGQVRCVVGVDACWQMARQAMGRADRIDLARAEKLPFKDGMFDICVCRQGLQFMDLDQVLLAIHRVRLREPWTIGVQNGIEIWGCFLASDFPKFFIGRFEYVLKEK